MDIFERLRHGNERFVREGGYCGDVSKERRASLESGQRPYAVVLTCSDSRVIPEAIFSAGAGELFVVRVAGNVATDAVLGSIEYAVEHLGAETVIVLGHTRCGAVDAALFHEGTGFTKILTDRIKSAIGGERDPLSAAEKNALHQADFVNGSLGKKCAIAAIYDISSGKVRFLPSAD